MKKVLVLFSILSILLKTHATEKFFVVERENSSVAVIQDKNLVDRIENLHNLNHAVIKFFKNEGYIITRDGYLIKFDPVLNKKLKEIKVGESSIGFVVTEDYIAVANYAKKNIVILDKNLNLVQEIYTDSKNVGIKNYKDFLIFSLMDKDEIWILKKENNFFKIFRKFKDVGEIPFDAMLKDNLYIVGFFNSPFIGVLDLNSFEYKKVYLNIEDNKPVLKVPHFGLWSLTKDYIIIPAVKDNKVFIFDKNFNHKKTLTVEGLPVFTSINPNENILGITFSGDKFPYLQIVDLNTFEIIKTFKFEGKVLHIRWSEEEPFLYASINDANKVIIIDTNSWEEKYSIPVKSPSGIFIFKY